jgi:ParB-like chromosome segregation protein Spo0J
MKARRVAAKPRAVERGREGDVVVAHDGEMRDPTKLKPHPQNSRRHTARQIDMLVASLEEFGFAKPVLIDEDDMIIAGHGTVQAAIKIGMGQVPVSVAVNWSDADKRAYLIADNRLHDLSAWDKNLLALEVGALQKIGVNIKAMGFEKKSIEQALRRATSTGDAERELGEGYGYAVLITCTSEAHQRDLLERFAAEGIKCRALIS